MRGLTALLALAIFCAELGCGASDQHSTSIDVRPLEENRAFEIIEEMLAERAFFFEKEIGVAIANKKNFKCDFRVKNNPIAIEYLTDRDRLTMGEIPPPAQGSRLHVLQGQTVPSEQGAPAEQLYLLFLDEQNFIYHYNPTSEQRADVTFMEVDSRLRRDLADFLSWCEAKEVKR